MMAPARQMVVSAMVPLGVLPAHSDVPMELVSMEVCV